MSALKEETLFLSIQGGFLLGGYKNTLVKMLNYSFIPFQGRKHKHRLIKQTERSALINIRLLSGNKTELSVNSF